MDKLIAEFTTQLKEAIAIGKNAKITQAKREIRNIVVTGLGGSGIGGNLVSEFIGKELKVPMNVNKDYFLPSYVDQHTLVIASSYSGNTEETLNAVQYALDANAKIVCVSSGGKLVEIAKENELDFVIVPGGNPPRASLGYSFVQQLFVLNYLDLISGSFLSDLENSIKLLEDDQDEIKMAAKGFAEKLQGTIPIIYATTPMASVAVRFRQQVNENSKMLCWHHVIPEMNHNELVGWKTKSAKWATIFLRSNLDFERNNQRIDINKEIISNYCETIVDITAKGNGHIEQALYLIHLTDWVSFYLAELQGIDPVEVKVIDFLKGSLAKVPLN